MSVRKWNPYPPSREASALLTAASEDSLQALWVLALTIGARSGELAGLKAGDVDLRSETLRIARTVYNGVVGTPESKRSRRTSSCRATPSAP